MNFDEAFPTCSRCGAIVLNDLYCERCVEQQERKLDEEREKLLKKGDAA